MTVERCDTDGTITDMRELQRDEQWSIGYNAPALPPAPSVGRRLVALGVLGLGVAASVAATPVAVGTVAWALMRGVRGNG